MKRLILYSFAIALLFLAASCNDTENLAPNKPDGSKPFTEMVEIDGNQIQHIHLGQVPGEPSQYEIELAEAAARENANGRTKVDVWSFATNNENTWNLTLGQATLGTAKSGWIRSNIITTYPVNAPSGTITASFRSDSDWGTDVTNNSYGSAGEVGSYSGYAIGNTNYILSGANDNGHTINLSGSLSVSPSDFDLISYTYNNYVWYYFYKHKTKTFRFKFTLGSGSTWNGNKSVPVTLTFGGISNESSLTLKQ